MSHLKQYGFTFVEMLIVLASLIFLFTIIAYTYDGIKARSRNDARTADIRKLQVYLETFYSQNTFYPSRADLNSPAWEKANLKGFSVSDLADPLWKPSNKVCTSDGNPVLLAKSQNGCFGYAPTNNGASCEKNDQTCDKYTLTATLESGGGIYTKTQLD